MKIRCFTALCFSPETLVTIDKFIEILKCDIPRDAAEIKWEKKKNIHLTLNFFGEIEETILRKIIGETKKKIVAHGEPIHLLLSGIGTFPNGRHPKVIWLGCEEKSGRLEEMQSAVNAIAQEFGEGQVETENRRFTPHVTIGRIKSLDMLPPLVNTLEKYAKNSAFSIVENAAYLSFMKSEPTSGGSLYTNLENIPL